MGMKHSTPSAAPGLIGAADWDDDHVIDGPLEFPSEASEPASPVSGSGLLYARTRAGRVRPKWKGAAGVDYLLQPHIGGNNIAMWRGGFSTTIGTTLNVFGSMSYSGVASSVQNPTPSVSNIGAQCVRSRLLTSTTAGNIASIRQASVLRATRGNAAGIGGFDYTARFILATLNAAQRSFVGLWNGTSNPTNLNWTTDTATSRIGIVTDSNTGNLRLAHNTGGAAPTLIDLGTDFAINNTHLIELNLFCAPNDDSVEYLVRNLQTGAEASGSITTNLPGNTIFLAPMIMMTNNTAAAAVAIDIVSVYIETDY